MGRFHLSTLLILVVEFGVLLCLLKWHEGWLGKQSQEYWNDVVGLKNPILVIYIIGPAALLCGTFVLLEWRIHRREKVSQQIKENRP